MNKYLVYGNTTVTVVVEVMAESEQEAYEKALNQRYYLNSYAGNGGTDKLIGVDSDEESVAADDEITYDDIELIESDCEDDENDN